MIFFVILYFVASYAFIRGVRFQLKQRGQDLKAWAIIFAPVYVWQFIGELCLTLQAYHYRAAKNIEREETHAELN